MGARTIGVVALLFLALPAIPGMKYDPAYVQWNLNTAVNATDVLEYSGVWENHTFHPSPDNWRFPFYTIMLDRFVNGDPTNDNANGTVFEYDLDETQLRHGGDIRGLKDSLDYLQGMGIKVPTCVCLSTDLGNLLCRHNLH
jgi:alpha-1,3-glucan synthase